MRATDRANDTAPARSFPAELPAFSNHAIAPQSRAIILICAETVIGS
jgi:hypothetical protein